MITGQLLYLALVVAGFVALMGALLFVSLWSNRKP